jgi:hypothetical protein
MVPRLLFSSQARLPAWSSGQGGFSLLFSSPYCPSLDLFIGD